MTTQELTNRNENSFIRNLFRLSVSKDVYSQNNIRHYNDLRAAGRRRVFKSDDVYGFENVWREILEQLNEAGIKGWRLYKGTDMRGGFQVGIQKCQAR